MTDLKTKIENRETELQRAFDSARFRLIELREALIKLEAKIKDEERIITLCKKRAKELNVENIM